MLTTLAANRVLAPVAVGGGGIGVWTDFLNASATGANLMISAANGRARASKQIVGDGYAETTLTADTGQRYFGLDATLSTIDGNPQAVWDYCVRITTALRIYENGIQVLSSAAFSGGDVLRWDISSGVVTLNNNGTPLYTSASVPGSPLYVMAKVLTIYPATFNGLVVAP